jgi:hypothetical protein
MPNEKDAEIKSRYEDYSVEELRAALDVIFDSTDEFSDSDVEKMDEIMAVLDKKDPLTQRYTAEESLKHFREYYREDLSRLGVRNTEEVIEKEPEGTAAPANAAVVRPSTQVEKNPTVSVSVETKQSICCRKVFHTALIAAATVAVMVIVTVSAAAAGVDIWKWVQVRGEGTVRFVAGDALSKDIPAALKQAGVEEPLFPTWIPEGFLLHDQQIKLDVPIRIQATYVYKARTLMINIRAMNNDSISGIIEIEEEDPDYYYSHGVDHCIIANCDQVVAYWVESGILVKISGDVSIEEMTHIIDSIYDGVTK